MSLLACVVYLNSEVSVNTCGCWYFGAKLQADSTIAAAMVTVRPDNLATMVDLPSVMLVLFFFLGAVFGPQFGFDFFFQSFAVFITQ